MGIVWQRGRKRIDLGTHVRQHCPRCGVERPFNIFLEYGYWGVFYIFNSVTDKHCKLLCYYCKNESNLDRSNSEIEAMSKTIPFFDRRGIPAFLGMSIVILAIYLLGASIPRGAIEALDAMGVSNSPAPTSVPAVPTDVTIRVGEVGILCSTEDEQARRAYNDGQQLAEQGKLEDAKRLYLQAVELDPGFCDAMDNLGRLLRSQGKVDEAISWYKRSIEVLPNNNVAHQNLAVAYTIQGKMSDAATEYQILVHIDPDNPEGYYGLGIIHLDRKQPQEAVTQLRRAEELYAKKSSPLISDARYWLGVSYYMLQKWENARNYFELVYSEMQDKPRINYFLGLCYLSPEIYNLELAKRYFGKAQELGVDLPADVVERLTSGGTGAAS